RLAERPVGAEKPVDFGVMRIRRRVWGIVFDQSGSKLKRGRRASRRGTATEEKKKSGGGIGNELHFQQYYIILQLQLAFFQTPQLQFVMARLACQHCNDGIQIAMLDFELDDAALYIFG